MLKMRPLFLNLFLLILSFVQAAPKDSLYHVRVISVEDKSPMGFARLKAMNSGIIIASWEADVDGLISINKKDIRRDPQALFTLNYPGFESKTFNIESLFLNDTAIMSMNQKLEEFDEIQIIAYKVPVIQEKEPLRWGRRQKQPKEEPEPLPVYFAGQCLAYEALQKGLQSKDTTTWNSVLAWDSLHSHYKDKGSGMYQMFQRYFMNNIAYPKQAIDLLMQEKIYMCFEFDEKGDVQYLQVMRGSHVDLVLEVANALARLPRMNVRSFFPDYQESYSRSRLKPLRFMLPVKFTLR